MYIVPIIQSMDIKNPLCAFVFAATLLKKVDAHNNLGQGVYVLGARTCEWLIEVVEKVILEQNLFDVTLMS